MLAGLHLELFPGGVGGLGQLDISLVVIRQPDDPAVVLRGPAGVPERELLDPDHFGSQASGEPVGSGAADPTQPQNQDPFFDHINSSRYRRMSIE